MDFDFTDEQEDFRASVRSFAREELAPGYLRRARQDEFPWDVARRLGEQGLLGLRHSEDYGGTSAAHVTVGVAVEELAKADYNAAYLTLFTAALGEVARLLPDHIRFDLMPKVIAGEHVLALALTEPGAGSDAAAITARAVRVDGGYELTGEKVSISCARHPGSFLVVARTDDGALTQFLVHSDHPGLFKQTFADHGFRPLGRGGFAFERLFVPADHRVGEDGSALSRTLATFDFSRALIGLAGVATALAAIEAAADYAKHRQTFGAAIARRQGVAFPLVEHLTYLESIRWLCYRTLWLRDRGRPHTKEAAQCKWWGPLAARNALQDCLLTYGNVGYSAEHPVGQQLLDVMASEIGDGTAQIQKIIIARELLGREAAPI